MTTIYATDEQAFRRAEVLKGRGVWPGVITRTDGTFALTHDPDLLGEVVADGLTGPGAGNRLGVQRWPARSRPVPIRTPYPSSAFTSRRPQAGP
jgi:hypothetical protein